MGWDMVVCSFLCSFQACRALSALKRLQIAVLSAVLLMALHLSGHWYAASQTVKHTGLTTTACRPFKFPTLNCQIYELTCSLKWPR